MNHSENNMPHPVCKMPQVWESQPPQYFRVAAKSMYKKMELFVGRPAPSLLAPSFNLFMNAAGNSLLGRLAKFYTRLRKGNKDFLATYWDLDKTLRNRAAF